MAKHHILCIHGIGEHTPKWVDSKDDGDVSFEETVRAQWQKYPWLEQHRFDDVVELHSICYDDDIRKLLKNWKDQAVAIKKALAKSELLAAEADWMTRAVDEASDEAGEADWRETHLADLLLILGLPTFQDALVTYIGDEILKFLRARMKQDGKMPQVSIVAHSAGCAMAHKAIQALYHEEVGDRELGPHFQFKLVCMIANTSFTLTRDRKNHYSGWARPSLTLGQGCCARWISVNHKCDPVGRFMKFDSRTPGWLDPAVVAQGWHHDILLRDVSSANIHSINHYFRDPAFHIPFFRLAFGAQFSEADVARAFKEFKATTLDGKLTALRDELEALDPGEATTYQAWFGALAAFVQRIRDHA